MKNENLNRWWPDVVARVRTLIRSKSTAAFWTPTELKILVPACEDLSDGLTRDRELIGTDYMSDPELMAAYFALYWPSTYMQAATVYNIAGHPPSRVLDLGCGTGAFVAAAIDAGAEKVLGIDLSKAALEHGEALIGDDRVTWKHHDIAPFRPRREFDVVTVGNVLNELKDDIEQRADLVKMWMKWLAPGGKLIVVEPALRDTTRALLQVRDAVLDSVNIDAPCLWRGPCPALESERDWCHGAFRWSAPHMVRQLAEEVGVKRESTKMAYLVLSTPVEDGGNEKPDSGANIARVVSEPRHTKGRLRYFVCGEDGRFALVAKERQAKSEAMSAMKRLPKGSVVEFGETEIKGDGHALTKESFVRIAQDPAEPWP